MSEKPPVEVPKIEVGSLAANVKYRRFQISLLSFLVCILFGGALLGMVGRWALSQWTFRSWVEDYQRLQGTWKVVTYEVDGQQRPLPDHILIVCQDGIHLRAGASSPTASGPSFDGKFTIERDQSIRTIDIRCDESSPNLMIGIYSIEQKMLRLCIVNQHRHQRPTKFTTSANDGRRFFVLQRLRW